MSTCKWLVAVGVGCAVSCPAMSTQSAERAKPKATEYFDAVRGCLDTLIDEGTDVYGAEHTPMFSSVLDLKTRRIPEKAPPLLPGQRKVDRAYPDGNLHHDLFTLLVRYHVSELTGEGRYREAADAYLAFFLRRCAGAGNGLFPCGEHAFWDFEKEAVGGKTVHECLGLVSTEFLEKLWAINPKAVERHIRKLEMHMLGGDEWIWNRHAYILKEQRPGKPLSFPRHGGFYLYQWAWLYTRIHDPQLLEWAGKTTRWRGWPYHTILSMGLSMLRVNKLLGDDKLPQLEKVVRECLMPILEAEGNDPRNGVLSMFAPEEGKDPSRPTYGFWDHLHSGSGGYGFPGAEKCAIMCLCAHRLVGSPEHLQFAKDVCDFYLEHPRPRIDGITPGKLFGQMALSLDLHDLTGEAKYLEYARQIADLAVTELYSDGLFRAATGAGYSEAANGVGPLLLELLRLHLVITSSDYPLPRNYDDT